jgi:hypothetical protein
MAESIDRREGLRRGAVAALALSLGVPAAALARPTAGASRFQLKFWAGDRHLETIEVGEAATRYLGGRPTSVQLKWHDLAADERLPLSTLGFTESRQMKIEFTPLDGGVR